MINNPGQNYARVLFFCFGIRATETDSGTDTLHGISLPYQLLANIRFFFFFNLMTLLNVSFSKS